MLQFCLIELFKVNAVDVVRCRYVLEGIFKEFKDLIRTQLFMQMIGNGFCGIAHSLAHLRRQIQTVFRLQNIADTALSRLAVDADDVCIVVSSDIGRSIGRYGTVQVSGAFSSIQCMPFAIAS